MIAMRCTSRAMSTTDVTQVVDGRPVSWRPLHPAFAACGLAAVSEPRSRSRETSVERLPPKSHDFGYEVLKPLSRERRTLHLWLLSTVGRQFHGGQRLPRRIGR